MRKKELRFKLHPVSVLFAVFYLLYLAYCAFTRDAEQANKYLEYKLSFLVFPLMASFLPRNRLSVEFPIAGFLLGTLYLIIYGFIHSIGCYTATSNGFSCFLTVRFSSIHHPSYFSAYLVAALFLVWYARYMHYRWMKLWLALLVSMLIVVATGLCLSLAGMLYLMLVFMAGAFIFVYKKWGRIAALVAVILSPVIGYLAIQNVPQLRGEWEGAMQFTKVYAQDPEGFIRSRAEGMSGSEERLVMWTVSAQALGDYPMGVGTGNVDQVLGTYLNRLGQKELAKLEHNPHNQYLQTGVEIGWGGIILILVLMLVAIRIGWKYRNWLLLLLVTNLAFNMLFESMLQRQSGIIFYTFGICLLTVFSVNRLIPRKERPEML
jgi:O-antigen ligase